MNSAIIGDSPIMLILANYLKNKENITIYSDKNKIGGAWSYINHKNFNISRQTNVVVPVDKNVEKLQPKINKSLIKYGIKITKAQGYHKPNVHLAKKNYRYDFTKLFESKKKFKNINEYVEKITVKNNIIKINNLSYDKVYLPYFNGVNNFSINKKKFYLSPKIISSKHILLIFKKLPIKAFVYTENFDHIFDRAQITKFKNFTSFTARVRLEHKKKTKLSLIKKSKIHDFAKNDNMIFSSLLRYKNYFRDIDNIKKLKSICNHKNIKIIDTYQFFEAYIDLNKKFLKHF